MGSGGGGGKERERGRSCSWEGGREGGMQKRISSRDGEREAPSDRGRGTPPDHKPCSTSQDVDINAATPAA